MKVALCLIARLENKYIREYIEYYKNLGFDKIFIYDNNHPNEERIIDELQDYVDCGFVDITEWSDFSLESQRTSYQDCYDRHKSEYDWISFFDADEYLVLNTFSDIHKFLSNEIFDDYFLITVGSIHYDDNDIIINDSRTRLDKYTRVSRKYNQKWVKSIIRCKDNDVDFMDKSFISFHLPKIKYGDRICDVDGTIYNRVGILYLGEEKNAYLKHIPTGCIDDFIKNKDYKGHIDSLDSLGLTYFQKFNDLTLEKEEYYNKHKKV